MGHISSPVASSRSGRRNRRGRRRPAVVVKPGRIKKIADWFLDIRLSPAARARYMAAWKETVYSEWELRGFATQFDCVTAAEHDIWVEEDVALLREKYGVLPRPGRKGAWPGKRPYV